MTTVITGAAGFVGRALARRMAAIGYRGSVRLVDRTLPPAPSSAFEAVAADLTHSASLADVLTGATCVIHLAALPGGAAEADPAASRRINLDASLDLVDLLTAARAPVRLVYASSVAVLGDHLPNPVDDLTPPLPAMVYGAHKRMVEIALADAVRRGLDAIPLRLPGIVARPAGSSGLRSAFISDVFHAARDGRPRVIPVGPAATMWLVSAEAAAVALLHATTLPQPRAAALTLPALQVTMTDLIAAIGRATGRPVPVDLVSDPDVEAQFGRLPVLRTAAADALGFVHDGDLETLVTRVLHGLARE